MIKSLIHRTIVPMMVAGTLMFVHPHAGTAHASPAAKLEFRYEASTASYTQELTRTPVAGGRLEVVYSGARRDVLFKHADRLWMRHSFDGWATCRDTLLSFDEALGRFAGTIDLPPHAGHVSLAFFSTYETNAPAGAQTESGITWHFLWDSAYGKNFDVKVIGRRELEEKRKTDLLDAYVAGKAPDKYTTEATEL